MAAEVILNNIQNFDDIAFSYNMFYYLCSHELFASVKKIIEEESI